MSTLTTAITYRLPYDRETRDHNCLVTIGDDPEQSIGYAPTYHAAEIKCQKYIADLLASDLLQTATALDGGSSQDEIATEYAAALPTVATVTINEPGLREASIPVTAGSTVELVRYDWPLSANLWTALLVDGAHYPLIMTKFIAGRPHHQEALDRALTQVQQAIAALQTTGDDQPDTDPGHNITLPDPAECPDISAPQPVEDLPRCEQRAVAPRLALWGPGTPECSRCGTRHDPVVACPVSVVVAPEPEHAPLPPSWPERPDLYIVTNGREYACFNLRWYADKNLNDNCLHEARAARLALSCFNGRRKVRDPEWRAIAITLEAGAVIDLPAG